VRVIAMGYGREYYDNVTASSEARPVAVSLMHPLSGIDFVLTQGGSISGRVYLGDGVTPIGGAEVWLRPSKHLYDEGFWAMTSSDGDYVVENLALGAYRVTASSSGWTNFASYYKDRYGWESADDVAVVPPVDAAGIDIRLDRAGSISGLVYASDNGKPIAGIGVWADIIAPTFMVNFHGVSAGDGRYVIEGILPGQYALYAQAEAQETHWYAPACYRKTAASVSDPVSVAAGKDTPNTNFELYEGGQVSGHVYDDTTGAPLRHLVIYPCLPDGDCRSSCTAVSQSSDGSYTLTLKPGRYLIRAAETVRGGSYVDEFYKDAYDVRDATPVTVERHAETSGIDFYLAKSGSISGYVYDEDGRPISDAAVYAFGDVHPGNGANTQADGSYTIEGLPSGEYVVQVSVSGYVSQYHNQVADRASATRVVVNAPANTGTIDFHLTHAPK